MSKRYKPIGVFRTDYIIVSMSRPKSQRASWIFVAVCMVLAILVLVFH